jgi:predicted Zn-dependent protease
VSAFGDLAATGLSGVGYGALRLGLTTTARRCFLFALKANPHHFAALRFSAWGFREVGDLIGAVRYYTALLALDPSFVEGRVELGFVLSDLERYPEALEQFERALEHSPRDAPARRGLAAMMICINHPADAIRVCEELIRDEAADFVGWRFLARARLDTCRWHDALAAYETAQQLCFDPNVALEHASLLVELDRHVDAEAALKGALASHARDRALRAQLAFVLVKQRRYLDASTLLEDVLREDPVNPTARQVLATLLTETCRVSEAAAVAERLVVDFPDDPNAHATVGWVAIAARRWQDALTAFDEALRIEPERLSFMAGRATALQQVGGHPGVRALVTRILERDPSYFDRHAEYAELLASGRG